MNDSRNYSASAPPGDLDAEVTGGASHGTFLRSRNRSAVEFNPTQAQRLVRESGVSGRTQRQTLARLPGQPMALRTRLAGGVLLAITVFNEVAPLIQASNERDFSENVLTTLNDIMWWQAKGIFPYMEGRRWTAGGLTTMSGRRTLPAFSSC